MNKINPIQEPPKEVYVNEYKKKLLDIDLTEKIIIDGKTTSLGNSLERIYGSTLGPINNNSKLDEVLEASADFRFKVMHNIPYRGFPTIYTHIQTHQHHPELVDEIFQRSFQEYLIKNTIDNGMNLSEIPIKYFNCVHLALNVRLIETKKDIQILNQVKKGTVRRHVTFAIPYQDKFIVPDYTINPIDAKNPRGSELLMTQKELSENYIHSDIRNI